LGKVGFARTTDLTNSGIGSAIKHSLELIDFSPSKQVDTIVIKPNMCYYHHPSTGEVTDPRFVSALIQLLQEKFSPSKIFVVESDAAAMKCKYAFRMLEYDKLAAEHGVEVVNLSELEPNPVEVNINGWNIRLNLPKLLSTCDLFINVPKMKYMNGVKITCALKNMYGCNAYYKKSVYHKALSEAIVGINKIVKTHLVIVDGLTVCGKTTKNLNMVIASEDAVSADAACARILGISPSSINHLVLAQEHGVGNLDFDPVGDFSFAQKEFPKRSLRDVVRRRLAMTYLRLFHNN